MNSSSKRRILFIHAGRASYPEIAAYRAFLQEEFATGESTQAHAAQARDSADILWYIMGFYPRRLAAPVIIHDYRSLSVGKGATMRDWAKRWFNHRPSLRIFLNTEIREELGFMDGVPFLELDMGVPAFAPSFRRPTSSHSRDFCYIGELSRKRDTHLMVQSFLRHCGPTRRLFLVGPHEKQITKKFASNDNVVFTGKVPQERAFEYVAKSAIAVCYVPNRRPYNVQTPTKLLEYAALGKPILANACPSILKTASRYGIRILATTDDLFAPIAGNATLGDNFDFDPTAVTWPRLFERVNLRSVINDMVMDELRGSRASRLEEPGSEGS